jgi:uncharacterized membrane protein (UPF0127 family)
MFYGNPKIMLKTRLSLLVCLGIFLIGCSAPTVADSSGNNNSSETTQSSSLEDLGQKLAIEATAKMGDRLIELEVAKTPQQQALGLMYRQSLPANRGMLFLFDNPQMVRFWMKNVSIDLDLIFLSQGEIQAIASNVPPCQETPCPTYGPDVLIDQVIELRGGIAQELGIEVGDRIIVEFLTQN